MSHVSTNTSTEVKPISLLVACRQFFGQKPGQTMTEFSTEMKALTDADREYFALHLRAAGYFISEESAPMKMAA